MTGATIHHECLSAIYLTEHSQLYEIGSVSNLPKVEQLVIADPESDAKAPGLPIVSLAAHFLKTEPFLPSQIIMRVIKGCFRPGSPF